MTGLSPDDAASAQWLVALAGQPDVQADGRLNRQAAALLQALQQRSRQLDPGHVVDHTWRSPGFLAELVER